MTSTYTLSDALTLFHADCREAMRALPSDCIDAVVTDPPYNIESVRKRFGAGGAAVAQHGRDGAYARLSARFVGVQWDDEIAFDVTLWQQVLRVLKPGGHIAAFGFPKRAHRMVVAIEDAGFEIRDGFQWLFGTGQVRRKEQARPGHEPICIARRPLSEGTLQENVERWGVGGLFIDAVRPDDGRWPTNVIHTDAFDGMPWFYHAKASKADRAGSAHPTIKPVTLLARLARLITPPGGVILDPFAGSGTTGAAAMREGFKCILAEREAEYVGDILSRFGVAAALETVDNQQAA